jgi:uncharacterized protein YprB with RNaseH-like and TPR domain
MSSLAPVAFDIETTGFDSTAIMTVAGFSHELGSWIVLNRDGRSVEGGELVDRLSECSDRRVELKIAQDEQDLLQAVQGFAESRLSDDTHYLTAYNGETWKGGFDLPFLRRACHRNDVEWPFNDLPYADMMDAFQRFNTDNEADLVGVYDELIGGDSFDPFEDSADAVTAFENGEWLPLLKHNLADIERTRELAELAGRFVPRSDFSMKNLTPPRK